jgi:L-threonine-O-3-phosphate decarboxylase
MVPPGHLDFAVNVWPGGPPLWLRDHLAASFEQISSYPSETAATAALADRHRRRPEEVLPLNGAAEAFWLLAAALRPRLAAVVHPTFGEPEAALRAHGRTVVQAFRDPETFALDPATVPAAADLVVLGNPNNPTGNLEPARTIEALVRPGRVVVVDEAFMEFSPGEPDSLAQRTDLPGLVIVRSLTKLWSLPGLRAGYLLAPADLVSRLRDVRQPWPVSALALTAMVACAQAEEERRRRAEEATRAREALAAALARIPGITVWPSAANFLLIRVPNGPELREALLARGVAVRPAQTFPGLTPHHLRITVRRPEENDQLLRAMRALLG